MSHSLTSRHLLIHVCSSCTCRRIRGPSSYTLFFTHHEYALYDAECASASSSCLLQCHHGFTRTHYVIRLSHCVTRRTNGARCNMWSLDSVSHGQLVCTFIKGTYAYDTGLIRSAQLVHRKLACYLRIR